MRPPPSRTRYVPPHSRWAKAASARVGNLTLTRFKKAPPARDFKLVAEGGGGTALDFPFFSMTIFMYWNPAATTSCQISEVGFSLELLRCLYWPVSGVTRPNNKSCSTEERVVWLTMKWETVFRAFDLFLTTFAQRWSMHASRAL